MAEENPLSRVSALLDAAAKWLPLIWLAPGTSALILYTLSNHIFSLLVGSLTLPALGLITAALLFLGSIGWSLGALSFVWLAIIVGARRSRNGRRPFLLTRREAYSYTVLSLFAATLLVLFALTFHSRGRDDLAETCCYFLLSGFLTISVLSPLIHGGAGVIKLFGFALIMPFVSAPVVPNGLTILPDVLM